MKSVKTFAVFAFLFGVLGFFLTFQACTHDDDLQADIGPPDYEYGDDVITTSGDWSFDQNHSNVRWETLYLGSGALLTGRFNEFEIDLEFYEDHPENIEIYGRVVLSTVNTGEPARDDGCLQGTLGVEQSDEAIFTSDEVEFDGSGGYNVTGTLDFHGVQDEVVLKLQYVGTTFFDENSGVNGAPLSLAGFTGEFQMNAKTIFGIESGNISDLVVVKINAQFKRPE